VPVLSIWWLISFPLFIDRSLSYAFLSLAFNLTILSIFVLPFVTIGAQIYRFRHASVIERQQMKWGFWGVITWFGLVLVMFFGALYMIPNLNNPTLQLVVQFILIPLPNYGSILAIAFLVFAITRYRLWDIDIVINRSLVGLLVTGALLIVFVVSAFLLQSLLQAENQVLAFGLSAIVPALLFNPTRKRVRQFIDRRVYGFRFDLNELRALHHPQPITNPGKLTGKVLEGYEVQGVIGTGGMGEVYQGIGDGKTVAIKTMLPKIAQDTDMRRRFEREAEAGMLLDHPHIAKVYTHGETDGTPYLVMDYIEGQDLSAYLKTGGVVDEETAPRLMHDIGAALDMAHQQGFVHRDLKPGNIMIRPNGQAVLMDFGVTKMTDASSSLTGTGAIGTIDYMAPEQIMSAKEVDHSADIYALGVMLFEMMTGE
jgi:predicted Ser/Thr protein kinase